MSELIFVKLGGSFLTDKSQLHTLHEANVRAAARQISAALTTKPAALVIGHGAGSFGHVLASRYQATEGVHPEHGWEGFYRIRTAMTKMNLRILELFAEEGLEPVTLQPSALFITERGKLAECNLSPVATLLSHGQIPLIHGDIILDRQQGFTIVSTESQLAYLAASLPFTKILMVSDVPGVLDQAGHVIPLINHGNVAMLTTCLDGAKAIDVTGGMRHKVMKLLDLAAAPSKPSIIIFSGYDPADAIAQALIGPVSFGTTIG